MISIRIPHLFFVFALALVFHGQACFAAPLIPQGLPVAEMPPVEGLEDEDEEVEEEVEKLNDLRMVLRQDDDRKRIAAKKFQLSRQYAVKIAEIDRVCGLDEKQKIKLEVASKGATGEALESFAKQRKEQNNFGGFFGRIGNDDDDKKKKKPIVVNDVDEIDKHTLMDLAGKTSRNRKKLVGIDVPLWNRAVESVLDDEQQKKFKAHVEKQKFARGNARADAFVASMRIELSLSDSQLDEFDKLVRPTFLERDINVNWQHDFIGTLYLGSKHDKKKMKKLLSEDQYSILTLVLKPAKLLWTRAQW